DARAYRLRDLRYRRRRGRDSDFAAAFASGHDPLRTGLSREADRQYVGQRVAVEVRHELVELTLHDPGEPALTRQDAVGQCAAQALNDRQIVFHVAHHGAQLDLVWCLCQSHATVLAPRGFDPPRLGEPVRDFHEVWL